MRRRDFIALLGGTALLPQRAAFAQAPSRLRRVAILTNLPQTDPEGAARFQAFRGSLEKLGWAERRTVQFEYRSYSGNRDLARTQATELVAMNPDVIFATPSSAIAALQSETRSIPIVFAQVSEPVGSGFVDSLARPGGNITGFATVEFSLGAKWLELLKQIAPSVTRAAVFYDPGNPTAAGYLPLMEAAARRYSMRITTSVVRDAGEIERMIEAFAHEPNGGLVPLAGPLTVFHRDVIVSLANRHRLPSVYPYRFFAANGGLASYGVDNIETYRLAASYVDRILKGEKPGDLPGQMPTKLELVINRRTANALGLDVPPSLLARADEVIE